MYFCGRTGQHKLTGGTFANVVRTGKHPQRQRRSARKPFRNIHQSWQKFCSTAKPPQTFVRACRDGRAHPQGKPTKVEHRSFLCQHFIKTLPFRPTMRESLPKQQHHQLLMMMMMRSVLGGRSLFGRDAGAIVTRLSSGLKL